MEFYQQSVQDVLQHFSVSTQHGLDSQTVQKRLEEYGKNQLPDKESSSFFSLVVHQFKNPLIPILVIAAIVTLALQEVVDSVVIAITVVLNVALGSVQEFRAQEAINALKQLSTPAAAVIRDGVVIKVPAAEIVPGDILRLEEGDVVAADARVVEESELEASEGALTGESQPVKKETVSLTETVIVNDQTNMVFAGTHIVRGTGKAVVIATGDKTQIGSIALDVSRAHKERTPLQKSLNELSNRLVIIVLIAATIFFALGLITGQGVFDMFLLAIALAVSVVPEGLVIAVTIALAVGMHRMAKRKAIVRTLPAVEGLGSVTIIASDKTGTITENKLSVQKVYVSGVHQEASISRALENDLWHRLLQAAVLTNNASFANGEIGDPLEIALLRWASNNGVQIDHMRSVAPRVLELPFSSNYQLMAVLVGNNSSKRILMKGSPSQVIARTTFEHTEDGIKTVDDAARQRLLTASREIAALGLKPLTFAYVENSQLLHELTLETLPSDFVFLGLVGFADTIRPGVHEAINSIQQAEVRVMMLTGDHRLTAQTFAQKVGIQHADHVLKGSDIDVMDDAQLSESLKSTNVFARVTPKHKMRLVNLLQGQGEVVAMTGDGVNDAPALVKADVGVAMGNGGTDVARGAADIVLTDNSFTTIVAAIEEGRAIFENLRKVVLYLLSTNAAEVFLMVGVVVARIFIPGLPLPLYPTQILWLNLVTDSLPDIALIFEPKEPGLLARPPRPRTEFLLNKLLLNRMLVTGVAMALIGFGVYWHYLDSHSVIYAQTMVLTTMAITQLFNALNVKSMQSVFGWHIFQNKILLGGIAIAALLQVAVIYVPFLRTLFRTTVISAQDWLIAILVGSLIIFTDELWKLAVKRLRCY